MEDDDTDISELIRDWQELQIRAAGIVRRLEAAETARRTSHSDGSRATPVVNELIVNGIRRGDRVKIKNKFNKPATWPAERRWDKEEAKLATVTKVTREQVHFTTDNGVRTWRAPNNLERIDS